MSQDELQAFAARFAVDMTLAPTEAMLKLLANFDEEDLLGRFNVEELVTQERVEKALAISKSTEQQMAATAAAASSAKGAPAGGKKEEKKAPVWYWVVELDDDAQKSL